MKDLNFAGKSTFNNLPADKREMILREAVREFGNYGFRQASVNRIVERTGIAKGSLYQYFANKEALFLYVFGRFAELIKKTVREAAGEGAGDFFIRMAQVMRAGERFVRSDPDYFRLYLKLAADGDIPRRAQLLGLLRLFPAEYFAPLLEEGQRLGLIRKDLRLTTMLFLIEGVIERFLQGLAAPAHSDDELVIELIALLRGGLSPASG